MIWKMLIDNLLIDRFGGYSINHVKINCTQYCEGEDHIRCTLLFADGSSYIIDKVFIRFVVFSFTMLCAANHDSVNQITPKTCLSRTCQYASSISFGRSLEVVDVISSHTNNS